MKLFHLIVIESLFIVIFFSCNTNVNEPIDTNPPSVSTLLLDNNSVVLSSLSIQGTSGSTLVIDKGTTVLYLDTAGVYSAIPVGNTVNLSLNQWDWGNQYTPQGEKIVSSFQITATINGIDAKLLFSCSTDSTIPGRPGTGAHFSSQTTDTTIHFGSYVNLYKLSSSDSLELVSRQIIGIQTVVLKKTHGDENTTVGPNGTGQFVVTTGAPSPSVSSTFPSGVYWTMYSNIPNNPYVVGGETYGESLFVGYVEIGEPSTAELMAGLGFSEGVNCVTYTNPNDHAQYWVERTQAPSGITTALKVGATVANLPYLNLQLCNIRNGMPELSAIGLRPDGGVHTPEGTVLTDPYQQSSLKFGGYKSLSFVVEKRQQGVEIREKVQAAGYEYSSINFKDGIYSFIVVETLDARKLLEENVLRKNNWYPDPAATRGNAGLYRYGEDIIIDITSHSNNEKVNKSNVTLSGTIDNPSNEWNPVTDMLVTYSSIRDLETREAHATIEDDGKAFSVDLDLMPGLNTITFAPIGQDDEGNEFYFNNFKVKVKGNFIDYMVLNYNANWTGQLEITWIMTSETRNSWTNEIETRSIVKNSITTGLEFDFASSKIDYIRESHANAVTCAGFDNCEIFSGSSEGQSPTLSEEWKNYTKGCDGELPLIEQSHGSGQASLPHYWVTVAAVLTPWPEGSSDTSRHYHLRVIGAPDWTINTDPNWPKNSGEYFDCQDSIWIPTHSKIGFQISLDKNDIPPILQFSNISDLENYAKTPSGARTWNFTGTKESSDDYSSSVIQYTATLTIQPN